MTRTECKENKRAFNHFTEGGTLWGVSKNGVWFKQAEFITNNKYKVLNIIGDEHINARKAYALGGEIEQSVNEAWVLNNEPQFLKGIKYRPKDVYDYHFTFRRENIWYMSVGRWQGVKEAMHFITGEDITKFEPSKKLKRQ